MLPDMITLYIILKMMKWWLYDFVHMTHQCIFSCSIIIPLNQSMWRGIMWCVCEWSCEWSSGWATGEQWSRWLGWPDPYSFCLHTIKKQPWSQLSINTIHSDGNDIHLYINNNNNNLSVFYSAFLNTQTLYKKNKKMGRERVGDGGGWFVICCRWS